MVYNFVKPINHIQRQIIMHFKTIFFLTFLAVAISAWAKSETKLPDTYAFTRGVEAYQEGKNQDSLDWFNK